MSGRIADVYFKIRQSNHIAETDFFQQHLKSIKLLYDLVFYVYVICEEWVGFISKIVNKKGEWYSQNVYVCWNIELKLIDPGLIFGRSLVNLIEANNCFIHM